MAEIAKSEKIIHHQLEILDIAGLVKGASSGEGLGNKFLANIREVDVAKSLKKAIISADKHSGAHIWWR